MAALDMNTLKSYVQQEDHLNFKKLAVGTVSITVTHSNLQQTWPELRFDLHTTIGALKDRLYRHGGTGAGWQRLILKSSDGKVICVLDDDSKKMGYYGIQSGQIIHIIDTDPYSFSKDGGLENVHLVKKYEMSDEDYDKRPGTLRAYKKEQLLKDPHFKFLPENRRVPLEPCGPETVEGWKVGDRCEVKVGGKRGEIMYIGDNKDVLPEGYWVGIKLDEPYGKHDGKVKGKRFFQCDDKYGLVIRPDKVNVGDYPELDDFDLDDSDDEL